MQKPDITSQAPSEVARRDPLSRHIGLHFSPRSLQAAPKGGEVSVIHGDTQTGAVQTSRKRTLRVAVNLPFIFVSHKFGKLLITESPMGTGPQTTFSPNYR